MSKEFKAQIGEATISFNTGYLAKQADGAVAVSSGETIVLATAVAERSVRAGQDFFPLTVDYREKQYAAGRIPGGFLRREMRPSDKEVLTSRMTDRPIRPLFPKDFINDVQVIIYVLSADNVVQPDVLAINAASAALSISGLPFKGPVGAVRVGRVEGKLIVNPTFEQSKQSDLDYIVAGTKKAVTMIEGLSKNVSEDEVIDAVAFAHEKIKEICEVQEQLKEECSKPPLEYKPCTMDEDLQKEITEKYSDAIEQLKEHKEKEARDNAANELDKKIVEELAEKYPNTIGEVHEIVNGIDKKFLRSRVLNDGIRADGRGLADVRSIDVMVDVLPRTHGSAIFTRGQTQSLGIATLGSAYEAQRLDSIEGDIKKRFMLHYFFPPFSTGETGKVGGGGRREIGHGMLAERALEYALPDEENFPYTIRVVSEILESNGSSSMASVCAGSLSLFNAGVPMKAPVAGIAMGLILESEDKYVVLTDILGIEDHFGDMDFKVAGTETGITTFQLDIKIEGITIDIMRKALAQAREARLHILKEMNIVIDTPAKELSPYVPKVVMVKINPERIGEIIGAGGKIIKGMMETSGTDINVDDDGKVTISAMNMENIEQAKNLINGILAEVEVGNIYDGIVKSIKDFGAFVEIVPGKEGLLHISNIDFEKTRRVEDVLKLGDRVKVKVMKIDRNGKLDLSRKAVLKS